jgi:thioredoxin 1
MENLKKILLVFVVVLVGVGIIYTISSFQGQNNSKQLQNQKDQINLQWNTDINSSLKEAQKSNKLVFIDFYTDWCSYCKELNKETFTDQNVKEKFAQKYVIVKINGDTYPDLTSKYKVYGYPTLVILDANGNEIKRQEGFVSATELLNIL